MRLTMGKAGLGWGPLLSPLTPSSSAPAPRAPNGRPDKFLLSVVELLPLIWGCVAPSQVLVLQNICGAVIFFFSNL